MMYLVEWHKALGRVCNNIYPDFDAVVERLKHTRKQGEGQLMFIGNGGSAAIASHMATDFMNKGRFNTRCFNDLAALTCLSNDYGYENVFSMQIARANGLGDVLIAISSSGESKNICQAVEMAKAGIITFTGFEETNRLRSLGHYNFYVPSKNYGIVETAHLGLLHALLEAVT